MTFHKRSSTAAVLSAWRARARACVSDCECECASRNQPSAGKKKKEHYPIDRVRVCMCAWRFSRLRPSLSWRECSPAVDGSRHRGRDGDHGGRAGWLTHFFDCAYIFFASILGYGGESGGRGQRTLTNARQSADRAGRVDRSVVQIQVRPRIVD